MKKNYLNPATEIAEVVKASQALASSGTPSGAPARATNATRSDYGEATEAW